MRPTLAITIILAILGGRPTDAKRDGCPYSSMWKGLTDALPNWIIGDRASASLHRQAVRKARAAAAAIDYSHVKVRYPCWYTAQEQSSICLPPCHLLALGIFTPYSIGRPGEAHDIFPAPMAR